MNIIQQAKTQFLDGSGAPLAGGSVAFYVPGTQTFKATYTDSTGATENANPLTLDANGCAYIWGSGYYQQVVLDAFGNQVWNAVASAPLSLADMVNGVGYAPDSGTVNAIVVTRPAPATALVPGLVALFQAANANTGATTVNVDNLGPVALENAAGGLTGGEIVVDGLYQIIYTGSAWTILSQSVGNSAVKGSLTVSGAGSFGGPVSAPAASGNGQLVTLGQLNGTQPPINLSTANATGNAQAVNLGQLNGTQTPINIAVSPATAPNQAVALGQVANVAPIQIFTLGGTTANTTYSNTVSFTAPCAGYVLICCFFGNNDGSTTLGDITQGLLVNGTSVLPTETAGSNTGWLDAGISGLIAAGTAITAVAQYTVGATALSVGIAFRGFVQFIPSP